MQQEDGKKDWIQEYLPAFLLHLLSFRGAGSFVWQRVHDALHPGAELRIAVLASELSGVLEQPAKERHDALLAQLPAQQLESVLQCGEGELRRGLERRR